MPIIFSFIMASLSMFSCSNQQKALQKITAATPIITLEKERTRGDRAPRYKVEIFDKKVMKYTGLANMPVIGERILELKKEEFEAILNQLSTIDFKQLESNYQGGKRDLPLTSISYQEHKVTYNQDNCPKQLNGLATSIEKMVSDKVLK